MLEIFDFFSKKISQILKEELVDKPMEEINTLEEIRIRSTWPSLKSILFEKNNI